MIRLLDTEVYTLEKKEINRAMLFSHFCSKGHNEDIIFVYEDGVYVGYICYQKLLSTTGDGSDSYIVRETYVHKPDDRGIWDNLKEMFRESALPYIPVCNARGEVLYMAYDDADADAAVNGGVQIVLENLECEPDTVNWLKKLYPWMRKVKIYDLNEGAERVFCILRKSGIPVETEGEKWTFLFPGYQSETEYVPESNILKFDADGMVKHTDKRKSGSWVDRYFFLFRVAYFRYAEITSEYREYFLNRKIRFFEACFPLRGKPKNMDEAYRMEKRIIPELLKEGGEIIRQQVALVTGYETTYAMWQEAIAARKFETIQIAGKIVKKKQYGKGRNHIYVIGPCIVEGTLVLHEEESFLACLYEKVAAVTEDFCVIGLIVSGWAFSLYKEILDNLTVTENDIVITVARYAKVYHDMVNTGMYHDDLNIWELLDTRQCAWFYDIPIHTNYIGNDNLSKHIVEDYLSPLLRDVKERPVYLKIGSRSLGSEEQKCLEEYIQSIKGLHFAREAGNRIGAIVMNCNPMTKGHWYLIEQASRQVDWLYIFIVQEDRSEVSFEQRFEIVKRQVAKNRGRVEHISVVPSGEFVLSYKTMPIYFEKEEKKDAKLDATADLQIFGEYIAPQLGITTRFVGEEPIDLVTRQYNEYMKQILPYYGINVTEIPRMQIEGEIVSASKVREYMRLGDWDKVKAFVPEETYNVLIRESCENKLLRKIEYRN